MSIKMLKYAARGTTKLLLWDFHAFAVEPDALLVPPC